MKKNILSVTKGAVKFFFDVDPVITEQIILQTVSQTFLIQREVAHVLKNNVLQGKHKFVVLLQQRINLQFKAA